MLLDFGQGLGGSQQNEGFAKLIAIASQTTRETDLRGWYRDNCQIGIIFTEIGTEEIWATGDSLTRRITERALEVLGAEQSRYLKIRLHILPPESGQEEPSDAVMSLLYPDFGSESGSGSGSLLAKRAVDLAGSLCALTVLSPVMCAIAAAVKLTSNGPVFFRQQRVGKFGRNFTFLKFRSMYLANDSAAHEDYVKRFIAGNADKKNSAKQGGVYKLIDDPRITPVGRFLRRTSLDELPQFFNVLVGQMSLVGPRPPIPYEVDVYDVWHRRRFLSVKPGITGLWQVQGRSRLKFDEMVRLDLRYARSWSIWLDIKILLKTPRAVLMGDGAY